MTIKVGYEQFVPPPVPPGSYFDRDLMLVLPEGVGRAGKGRVPAAGPWRCARSAACS